MLIFSPGPGEDDTQGCLAPATVVPTLVMVLVLLMPIAAVILLVWLSISALQLRQGVAREEIKAAAKLPQGIVGWASFAVAEHLLATKDSSGPEQAFTKRELKNWGVGLNAEGEETRIRIMRL